MRSDCTDVLNVGSDEMISINGLVAMIADVAEMNVRLKHIPGPLGVRGRNSDNSLILKKLGWRPSVPLIRGIEKTYPWIAQQVKIAKQQSRSLTERTVTQRQSAQCTEYSSAIAAVRK